MRPRSRLRRKGQSSLGDTVAARRGPVGNLLASCANLETPLPTIDMVNECLEYLGTAPAKASGVVYDTSEDKLAGFTLCDDDDGEETDHDCHEPVAIYAALPEYSTPATPIAKNQAVEPLVYNNLKADFSSCDLPYSQALDVSRTYLQHFGSCRFEEMRTFRRCITEFALAPANPPAGFQSFLRRYPVRIDIAIEYLGITPEEYTTLFQGSVPQACGQQTGDRRLQLPGQGTAPTFGFSPLQLREISDSGVIALPVFLAATCLSYCEFVELSKSGIPITLVGTQGDGNDAVRKPASVPDCEPCCLGDYQVQLPGDGRNTALLRLMVFIRLWRKLKCPVRRRIHVRAALRHLHGAEPVQRDGDQPRIHPPARRVPDVARPVPSAVARSHGGNAGRDGSRPHASAGSLGRQRREEVELGEAASARRRRGACASTARPAAARARGAGRAHGRQSGRPVASGGLQSSDHDQSIHRRLEQQSRLHAALRRGAGQDVRVRIPDRGIALPVQCGAAAQRAKIPSRSRMRTTSSPIRSKCRKAADIIPFGNCAKSCCGSRSATTIGAT